MNDIIKETILNVFDTYDISLHARPPMDKEFLADVLTVKIYEELYSLGLLDNRSTSARPGSPSIPSVRATAGTSAAPTAAPGTAHQRAGEQEPHHFM